jgi:hypothetical protein
MDCAVNPAATEKRGVRRIDDRIDAEAGDIAMFQA